MKHLPANVIADTLNAKSRRIDRQKHDNDEVPKMHVSSLIKSSAQDFFCPREFVLRYMERTSAAGAGTPPKFELLWGVGHFYGDYIVRNFLRRNPEWAQYAWGDWRCVCGHSKRKRQILPDGQLCNKCGQSIDIYEEVDLFNPARTVIGHADLIICIEGRYYIYEFKSIERADVPFDTLNAPLGDHIVQASNYYYMLLSEGKQVSRNIRYVYVDRSMEGLYTKLPFKEFQALAISRRRLANFYARAKEVHVSIENGTLPERICEDIGCSRAKQCSKAISCFYRRKKKIKRITIQ